MFHKKQTFLKNDSAESRWKQPTTTALPKGALLAGLRTVDEAIKSAVLSSALLTIFF
jgi:hypothetical protein